MPAMHFDTRWKLLQDNVRRMLPTDALRQVTRPCFFEEKGTSFRDGQFDNLEGAQKKCLKKKRSQLISIGW